jgi:hypothetical protein
MLVLKQSWNHGIQDTSDIYNTILKINYKEGKVDSLMMWMLWIQALCKKPWFLTPSMKIGLSSGQTVWFFCQSALQSLEKHVRVQERNEKLKTLTHFKSYSIWSYSSIAFHRVVICSNPVRNEEVMSIWSTLWKAEKMHFLEC